jgi:dolichol-phosphate mannosyltransferase
MADRHPIATQAGWHLSLIIPAYNEASGIRRAVAEAVAGLDRLTAEYEILVVDDGSGDATSSIVAEMALEEPRIRLLCHEVNRGYGAALRTGFAAARFDRVAFTDADCQFYLDDLAPLLGLMRDHDLAVGYRVDRQDPRQRRFYSWGYNVLIRTLLGTGVRDCDCALKVFRKDALAELLPETHGFFVNTEMLTRARQLGLRIAETGVRHRPRLHGQSTVSLRDIPRTLAALLPFWWSRVLFAGVPGGAEDKETSRQGDKETRRGGDREEGHRRVPCSVGAWSHHSVGAWSHHSVGARSPDHTRGPDRRSPAAEGAGETCGRAGGRVRRPGHNTGRPGHNTVLTPRLLVSLSPCLLLIAAAALLCYVRLGSPLLEPQESRYAEIPRQMLSSGNWLVPVLHGQPYCDKPPLLYWLVMGLYSVFGVHDWVARLVPSTATFLCVLIAYSWGKRLLGVRVGLAGAGILCLSARFLYLGRMLTMDSLLAFWIVAALAAAHLAISTGEGRLHRGWWLLSALACGLGLLAKGPVALALIAVPVLACQALDRRHARPRLSAWLAYLSLAGLVAGPWYAAMEWRQPGFLGYFLWTHNAERFLTPFDHAEPGWFYLPGLLLGMLPWTLLLPGLMVFVARRSARTARRRPGALGFFLVASVWCLIFFSASGCKRPVYILPVMPPLALALGHFLTVLVPPGRLLPRYVLLGRRATLLMLVLGIGVTLTALAAELIRPGVATGAIVVMCAVVGLARWKGSLLPARRVWTACAGVTFVLLLAGLYQLLPAYNRKFSMRGQVRPFQEELQTHPAPVACYPRTWDSVSFYLRGPTPHVYSADQCRQLVDDLQRRPDTLLFVKSGRALQELCEALPPDWEFVPRGRQGDRAVGRIGRRPEIPPEGFAKR